MHRQYAYAVLRELSQHNSHRAAKIYRAVRNVHCAVPSPSAWDYEPRRDSRSTTGYVGLRNFGATCYMNSLLQVLFMNNEIREYILNCMTFVGEGEEELRNNLAFQLQKMFYHLKHSEKKVYSPTDWTFAFKDEFGVNPINVMQQQDAQEFLQLLCERFEQCVTHSHMKATHARRSATHDSTAGTTLAAANKPFDILQHSFAGGLCNQMIKHADSSTKAAGGAGGSAGHDARDIREQSESFFCLSLEVKGLKNLEQSLSKFVEGEQIPDFLWEEGAPRANITKRQCISRLSDTLILHLKRFELNFDTFRREKVNDAFAFPLQLDMLPYTKEGLLLAEQQQGQVHWQLGAAEAEAIGLQPAAYYEYELTGVIVHTGTSDSGHYFSYIKEDNSDKSQRQSDTTSNTAAATANGGSSGSKWFEFNDSEVSNFSLTRLEEECFGGRTTTHEYIAATQAVISNEVVNPKSAYMLVYTRTKKLNQVNIASSPRSGDQQRSDQKTPQIKAADEDDVLMETEDLDAMFGVTGQDLDLASGSGKVRSTQHNSANTSVADIGNDSGNGYGNSGTVSTKADLIMDEIRNRVELENAHQLMSVRVLSQHHLQFFADLVDSLYLQSQEQQMQLSNTILADYVLFIMRYIAHSACNKVLAFACDRVEKYLSTYQHAMMLNSRGGDVGGPQQVSTDVAGAISQGLPPPAPHAASHNGGTQPGGAAMPPPPPYPGDENNVLAGIAPSVAAVHQKQLSRKPSSTFAVPTALAGGASTATATAVTAATLPASGSAGSAGSVGPAPIAGGGGAGGSSTVLSAQEIVLVEWLRDFDMSLLNNLYAPSEEVRKLSASCVLQIVQMAYAQLQLQLRIQQQQQQQQQQQHGGGEGGPGTNPSSGITGIRCGKNCLVALCGAGHLDIRAGTLSTAGFGPAVGTTAKPKSSTPGTVGGGGAAGAAVAVPVTGASPSAGTAMAVAVPVEEFDDPDLALAIKMSQQVVAEGSIPPAQPAHGDASASSSISSTAGPGSAPVGSGSGSGSSSETASTSAQHGATGTYDLTLHERMLLLPRLLLELTADHRMQLLGENWRKAQSFLWVLLESARTSAAVRELLLHRDVIAQLVDVLLGEQSPLNTQLYAKGSRRRAPTSYVSVGITRDGSVPYSAKNTPDWTYLVELLSLLVCSSDSLNLAAAMGDASHNCILSKQLYNILFRQARYIQPTITMMSHLIYDNQLFTNMIIEVIFEELSLCTADGTSHIFAAMEKFLNVADRFAFHRCSSLLDPSSSSNILDAMRMSAQQPLKETLVCVFIRSFSALVQNVTRIHPQVRQSLPAWAPWMLRFTYQYMNKSRMDAAAAISAATSGGQPTALLNEVKASNGSVPSPGKGVTPKSIMKNTDTTANVGSSGNAAASGAAPVTFGGSSTPSSAPPVAAAASPPPRKGPFVVVYGESEDERDLPWDVRAERTDEALRTMIQVLGGNPNELIPADAFTDVPPLVGPANNANSITNNQGNAAGAGAGAGAGVNGGLFGQFADGMTDEELAMVLANVHGDDDVPPLIDN